MPGKKHKPEEIIGYRLGEHRALERRDLEWLSSASSKPPDRACQGLL